jgi:FMN phosphatase YigB (HAD superfamily)
MKIRAFILDVYGTLLTLGPPPADAEARWVGMWRRFLDCEPCLSRLALSVECNRVVAQRHALAHARGIAHPEIWWPSVMAASLPELSPLSREQVETFAAEFVSLGRSLRVTSETADFLKHVQRTGAQLGIASNAQAYTLRELESLLEPHGLSCALFNPRLCFWSFEQGFSKPSPHAFQILSQRLEALGITADETLVIGDRLDNDVEPARKHGFRAWHYGPDPDRNWKALENWLMLE